MAQPFIGEIRMVGFNFAPVNWAMCNGQTIAISQNTALYTLIGTTFGGDGINTFQLPDLRGRVPITQGTGAGLSAYVIGQLAGTENVTLTVQQIPQHRHAFQCNSAAGTQGSPSGAFLALDAHTEMYGTIDNGTMNPNSIGFTGGSAPHTNIQPILAITFVIALFGIFPTQN